MTESSERGDWAGLPFPEEEYADRIARLSDEMAKRGIDVLCISEPANLNYLTGYASVWYSKRIPTVAALARQTGNLVFYDYIRHKDLAATACANEVVVYGEEHYTAQSGVAAIVEDFRARGWTQGTVGLEDWSLVPVLGLREQIRAGLEQAGAKVADASWMVDHLRLFKSPREIVYVRRAAEIVNEAMEEIPAYIEEGVTEVELAARLNLLLAKRGGEEPALPLMVDSGYKASHALPTRRAFQTGDVISLDAAGVFNHYHVDCLREFSLGPNDRSQEIMSVTAGTVAAVCEHVKVGASVTEAQRIAEEYVKGAGLWKYVWWVGGYSLGVGLSPDWVGHAYLDGTGFEVPSFEPGYVTNFECILSSESEGWSASYIDTLLMTEGGLEILTTAPRAMTILEPRA